MKSTASEPGLETAGARLYLNTIWIPCWKSEAPRRYNCVTFRDKCSVNNCPEVRVNSRTIKSTKQVLFWLGKLNFWTNMGTTFFIIFRFFVANAKTKCLSAIFGHVALAICSIISSRLSLLLRNQTIFQFSLFFMFFTTLYLLFPCLG